MVRVVLLRLLESYFRHRWLYLLPILFMMVAAALFFITSKPTFMAKGVVYVQDQSLLDTLTDLDTSSAAWWVTPAQATVGDIEELMKTDAFIRAVIKQTNLEEQMNQGSGAVKELIDSTRRSIWVVTLGDNQVQIGANHEDPQVTYQFVNAVIEAYVQWQINAQRANSQTAQQFFKDLIAQYGTELNEARIAMRQYLEQHPEPIRGDRSTEERMEIDRLQSEIDMISSRYTSAMNKEEDARLAVVQIESDTRQSYVLIDAPLVPEGPETSRKELAINMAIFVGAGVILAGVAVVGAALLDRSFRFAIDVHHSLNLPVLAIIADSGYDQASAYTPVRTKQQVKRRFSIRKVKGEKAANRTPNVDRPAVEADV